ncbi:hypothetical protein B0G73_11223 [Paraburkholderia sp. BL25I1N1]|nr:hypothetical protein B0G73_11223 [Paraburkholderia sp. BL25I1N1]
MIRLDDDRPLLADLGNWVAGNETMHVIRASAQYTPAKVRAFIDWMAEVFADPPWIGGRRERR